MCVYVLQLSREETHRNEAEGRLHVALEQLEELQKKFDATTIERDNEIRSLKEEVGVSSLVFTWSHVVHGLFFSLSLF